VVRFDDEVGAFSVERIGVVEHGPVKAVLRVESSYGSSHLVQDFTVYAALDRVDVEVTVDWREQFKALKLRFPVNLDFVRATCEIPYGSIEREADSRIAPETGETYGLSILNDGKYGLDVRGEETGLTVLRSPIYAHHDPFVPRPDESYSFIDQGIQRFTYALLPHADGWEAAGTVRHAAELNQRPVALIESHHEGPLPEKDSYLSVEPDNVILEVLKQAEDGDDLIVRCRETCKKATGATIQLPRWSREIEADFAPSEIKTFRVPRDETLPVIETDLLEWEVPEG
jgi:alpha-mannosidase